MGLARQIKRLNAYVNRFGVADGVWNFRQSRKKHGIVRIRTGGGHPELRLRAGSSDVDVFDEVFLRRAYTIDGLVSVEPRVIIDAGANCGITSVYFAQLYPKARIISIEPEQSNFDLLRENASHYKQVTPVRGALWGTGGQLSVENPGRGFWSFQVSEKSSSSGGQVNALTVQALMDEFKLSEIDLFKIDIEGAERELFAGPTDWLDSTHRIVIELHDRFSEGCTRGFYAAIGRFPFQQEIKDKNLFVHLRRQDAPRVSE